MRKNKYSRADHSTHRVFFEPRPSTKLCWLLIRVMARLPLSCGVIMKIYPIAAKVVAKRRFGPRHNKSRGMRSRRGTSIPQLSSVVCAVKKSRPDAQKLGVSISKGLRARKPRRRARMIARLTLLIVSFSWFLMGTPLYAAESDRLQRQLIEGAKKEGKMVFYT